MKQVTLRLDAYDEDARRYVAGAQQLADERENAEVEPIHLWYELVDRASEAQAALRESGVDPTTVLVESEWALRRVGKGAGTVVFEIVHGVSLPSPWSRREPP